MNILIVAATDKECDAIRKLAEKKTFPELSIEFLVTGVGMLMTTYWLCKKLTKKKYDWAINIGLAGSFRHQIKIGEVVNVVSDCYGDMGAEDDEKFQSIFELGLAGEDKFPFWNGKLKNINALKFDTLKKIPKVNSITVNKVHGNEHSITKVRRKFSPDIETMEGLAFCYSCINDRTPFIQLRAISNRVEKRNKHAWNIPLALENLKHTTAELLIELGK